MYYVYLDSKGRSVLSEERKTNKILMYSAPVKTAVESYVRRMNFEIQAQEKEN